MRALSSGTDCEAGDTASLAMARKGKAKGSGSQTLAAVATVLRKGSVTNGGERTVQGRGEGGSVEESSSWPKEREGGSERDGDGEVRSGLARAGESGSRPVRGSEEQQLMLRPETDSGGLESTTRGSTAGTWD